MKMHIPAPNYTKTPNDLFDHWLPHLGEAELKVLLVIMRKTFGWHKTHDEISVSQLAKITGMQEETVIKAARSLQNKGVITRQVVGENGKQRTIYALVIMEDSNSSYPSDETRGPLGLDPPVKTEAQKKAFPKEKSVCIADAKGSDKMQEKEPPEMQTIRRIDKKNYRGDDVSLSWDDLNRHAVYHKKDWRVTEMQEAWKILHDRQGYVNDLIEFISGTITNLRTKTRALQANRGKTGCKNQQTSKLNSEKTIPAISHKMSQPTEHVPRRTIPEILAELEKEAKQQRKRVP